MRYLFLRENVLFMVKIRFRRPEPHWTPYDVYKKKFSYKRTVINAAYEKHFRAS